MQPRLQRPSDILDNVASADRRDEDWVLLTYRLPREPSTPRIAVWRTLKRLGVAQLGDGVVALPCDARTREALGWVAEDVVDNGGQATVWIGQPAERAGLAAITARMSAAIAAEYDDIIAQASQASRTDDVTRRRIAARLTRELHRVHQRDFFPTPPREQAHRAVTALAPARRDRLAASKTGRR
jgi:hypothetical protein